MKIPKWVWIAGGAAGVGALLLASGDAGSGGGPQRTGAPKGPIRTSGGEGPQRTSGGGGPDGTSTYGHEGPRARGPSGVVEGQTTIVYTQTNNVGVIGGLVPFTQKDAPTISAPNTDGLIDRIASVPFKVYELVKQHTGGKLYPDSWTEPDGQMSEIAAVSMDGDSANIVVNIDVYAAEDDQGAWYLCRRLLFKESVEVSSEFSEADAHTIDSSPTGQKTLRACHYSARDYKTAGLSVKFVPRPIAPGEIVLYALMSDDAGRRRLGLYLWLPPRLGQHKVEVDWSVARR